MNERRFDIDWLRVISTVGIFIFHCTRFFDTEDWHLKALPAGQSDAWDLIRSLILWTWLLPLFFLLAGFATRYSLKKRTVSQYLLERAKRLLIPIYTVGLFLIVVPQAYFERLTHGLISGSFWSWLPGYYKNLPGEFFHVPLADPTALVPFGFMGHLWFIQLLVVIIVLTLPVILYLRSDSGNRFIGWLARWSQKPGGIFLFVIPLAISQIAFRWMPVTTPRTWADFFWYAIFFIFGYILSSDERFIQTLKKNGWLCLVVWIVFFVGVGGAFELALQINTDGGQGFSLYFVIWQIAWSVICWSSVVFFLSIGAKYLNFTNKTLAYCSEAVLPFFLLHQTIILIVGWYILPLPIGSFFQFLIILTIAFPLTLLIYEVFVRRIGFMRFLFGMNPEKKQPQVKPEMKPAGM